MGYPHGQWRAVILGLARDAKGREGPIPPEIRFSLSEKPVNVIGYFDAGPGKKFLILADEKARQVPSYRHGESEVNFIVFGEMEKPDAPSPRWELVYGLENTREIDFPGFENGAVLMRTGKYGHALAD